jgi:hypothetical protein
VWVEVHTSSLSPEDLFEMSRIDPDDKVFVTNARREKIKMVKSVQEIQGVKGIARSAAS